MGSIHGELDASTSLLPTAVRVEDVENFRLRIQRVIMGGGIHKQVSGFVSVESENYRG